MVSGVSTVLITLSGARPVPGEGIRGQDPQRVARGGCHQSARMTAMVLSRSQGFHDIAIETA
jgi:hypothetical protein